MRTRSLTFALALSGLARCDNRVAHIMHAAGLTVTNPALALPSYHVQSDEHNTNEHSYPGQDQVPGAMRYVPISDQWLF